MLRRVLTFSALAAIGAALSMPAVASPITGDVSVSGTVDYTNDNGTMNFFAGAAGPTADALGAVDAFGAPSAAASFTAADDFAYDGSITPVVLTSTEGGVTTTLTMDSLTGVENIPGGWEITADGIVDETGYDPTMATVSFILQSQYVGNNVNLLMFQGIAQTVPAITPEPSSILLLGTGLLGLAGLVQWRIAARERAKQKARARLRAD